MKHIYTTLIALFVLLLSVQIASAQGQNTIDISPKCALADRAFELTVNRLTGNDFNGSTSVSINGQVYYNFVSRTKDQIVVAVPANTLRTAGNIQVVANTASGVSQAVVLSVVGPLAVTATPGCDRATLTATGAPATGRYQWYNTNGQAIAGATSASYTATQVGQYAVSIVTSAGCETARVSVNATFLTKQTAVTEFAKQEISVGKPAVLQLNSQVFDRGHGASIRWEAYNFITGDRKVLGITQAPQSGPASFQIASVEDNTYYEAFISVRSGFCYDEYMLYATTQGIVSLPVELTSFKGQRQSQGVALSWATASELDNKGFEVQVSTDARNFKTIAFVESKVGTTALAQNYSFTHKNPAAGINYYRLRQVDFDGTFEFSKTIAVQFEMAAASSVYPTMATEQITVKLMQTDEQASVVLTDMNGRQLLQLQNPAEREVTLPVSNLQQGMYFVTVLSGTSKETFRVMKR